MRWTPPGDLNGIKVPKSSRSVRTKPKTGGIHREEYDHRHRSGKVRFRNWDLEAPRTCERKPPFVACGIVPVPCRATGRHRCHGSLQFGSLLGAEVPRIG